MPRIKYPESTDANEKLKALIQGFLLEMENQAEIVLYLKLDASINEHILKGCPIDIAINFENGYPYLQIEIFDNPDRPFIIRDNIKDSDHIEYLNYFNQVIRAFKNNQEITIAIFDLNFFPLACYSINTNFDDNIYRPWIRARLDGDESVSSTFNISLHNIPTSTSDRMLTILNLLDENDNVKQNYTYDYNNIDRNGMHGYSQEHAILGILDKFFQIETNLFISPLYKESGKEYTDFVVLLKNTVILIESKYCISSGNRNIRDSLKKASSQLFRAQKNIKKNHQIVSTKGKDLKNEILNRKKTVRLTLLNSSIDISDHNNYLKKLLTQSTNDFILPAFSSTTTVYQFLGELYNYDPENFEKNLEEFLEIQLNHFNGKYKSVPIFAFH